MSYRDFRSLVIVSVASAALFGVVVPVAGQAPGDRVSSKTPTAAAQTRVDAIAASRKGIGSHEPTPGGWVEELGPGGLQVRCIMGFNSGPPMTPAAYNQNVQLFQSPGYVVILNEMIHNARIVPLDGRPHGAIRQWAEDSRGH